MPNDATKIQFKPTDMDWLLLSNLHASILHYRNPLCMFVQASERLQAQQVEECSCCDIEILNTRPFVNATTTLSDPEPLSTPPPPGSRSPPSTLSLARVPLQADYCPQSTTVFWDSTALQHTACVTNKTYFHTMEKDLSEAQRAMSSESNERSESLQESCSDVYGYISNDAL